MTRWELHMFSWIDCKRCEYSTTRKKVVLGRGQLPCDVLFIGEAPGPSENMLGLPFIGKAGKILDRIVFKVFGSLDKRKYRIAYNNIIACIPLVNGHEKEEPDMECVEACKPRLEEFIDFAQPRLIICVGKIADEWLDQSYKRCVKLPQRTPQVTIQHPASILRMPIAGQGLAEHKCGVVIRTALLEYLEG